MKNKTLKVTIKELNENLCGWEAGVCVDPGIPDQVSFDISWITENEDGKRLCEESVGVLMSPEGAREIARRLEESSYKITANTYGTKDISNG